MGIILIRIRMLFSKKEPSAKATTPWVWIIWIWILRAKYIHPLNKDTIWSATEKSQRNTSMKVEFLEIYTLMKFWLIVNWEASTEQFEACNAPASTNLPPAVSRQSTKSSLPFIHRFQGIPRSPERCLGSILKARVNIWDIIISTDDRSNCP